MIVSMFSTRFETQNNKLPNFENLSIFLTEKSRSKLGLDQMICSGHQYKHQNMIMCGSIICFFTKGLGIS